MYRNPDLSNSRLPTMAQLIKYLNLAGQETNRDPRPLMSVLQRLPQVDLHFGGLVQTRKLAVLGYDYTLKMISGEKEKSADTKRIAEMKERFRASKMQNTPNLAMNGKIFGMSATRLVWENDGQLGTRVRSKKSLSLTELDYDLENDDALVFLSSPKGGTFTRQPLNPETHIIVRYNPLEGIDNELIGSHAFVNMLYVWLRYFDKFHWARSNEKFGDPMIIAQYRSGAQPEEIAAVKAGLDSLGESSRAAVSDDIVMKFLEAQRSSIKDMHEAFQAMTASEMSINMLGQTLTTDIGDVGSRAAAEVHNTVRKDYLWSDLKDVEGVVTEQYVERDFKNNYSESEPCPYRFAFETDEQQDYEANARIVETHTAAGIPIKKSEAYAKTGFTEPEPDDEVFGGATVQSASPLSRNGGG